MDKHIYVALSLLTYGLIMAAEINHKSPIPVYRQLVDILRGQIERGELEAGQAIPSETELEQVYGLARGTIRKAVAALRDEGLIVTTRGKGSYVADGETLPSPDNDGDADERQ